MKICFVGSHTSALPNEVLKKHFVDIVLLNEGVYALINLLKCKDFANLSKIKGVDGVCLSSILHYKLIENYKKIPKTDYGNKEYLKSKKKNNIFNTVSISYLKKYLKANSINIRN